MYDVVSAQSISSFLASNNYPKPGARPCQTDIADFLLVVIGWTYDNDLVCCSIATLQVLPVESSTECSLLADVILTLYHPRSTRALQHAKHKTPSLGKHPRATYTEPIRLIGFQSDLDHMPGEEVHARCPLCDLPKQTYSSGYSV
jgi:hypothetical protein